MMTETLVGVGSPKNAAKKSVGTADPELAAARERDLLLVTSKVSSSTSSGPLDGDGVPAPSGSAALPARLTDG
jgi:hypothetical protein